MKQRERGREENGEKTRGENNFYGVPSNIHNTLDPSSFILYFVIALSTRTRFMVFQPRLYALI